MASADNIIGKIIAWETGCQRKADEGVEAYYDRAKEYNRVRTNGTYTIVGDKGGVTVVGVTIATYEAWLKARKECRSRSDSLTRLKAMDYREWYDVLAGKFIEPWGPAKVANVSVLEICVDFGWLCGVQTAIKRVQAALGCTADGVVGGVTHARMNALPRSEVHARIKAAYKKRIDDIIKSNPLQGKFRKGWLNRIESYIYSE